MSLIGLKMSYNRLYKRSDNRLNERFITCVNLLSTQVLRSIAQYLQSKKVHLLRVLI